MTYNKNQQDTLVFKNAKGEEFRQTREESQNMRRGLGYTEPRFEDRPLPNLKTGLDYVEKATHKREDAMILQHIENKRGRVVEEFHGA